jgi:hypothetical protein
MESHYALPENSIGLTEGQYQISREQNGITHRLTIQRGQRDQYPISSAQTDITHFLEDRMGRNEVGTELVPDELALRTS